LSKSCVEAYRDTAQPFETRLNAAKAALPFEKPRLAAVQLEEAPHETVIRVIGGLPN
jgi:hypothetical protein